MNRCQIREAFVREFLAQNISEFWGIGTGEVIHKEALPEEPRNQIDVVAHNKKFPDDPDNPAYIFTKRRVGYWMEKAKGLEQEKL